jgi:hypothetical protein
MPSPTAWLTEMRRFAGDNTDMLALTEHMTTWSTQGNRGRPAPVRRCSECRQTRAAHGFRLKDNPRHVCGYCQNGVPNAKNMRGNVMWSRVTRWLKAKETAIHE